MPVQPTYPGVYVEEIPSGVRTITGVSTSVTAFVGPTKRGPVNQAVNVLSLSDYERSFGGLSSNSYLSYAVNQFFLNGGTNAWVVRLALNAAASTMTLNDEDGNPALIVTALNEGTDGNDIQVLIDHNTIDPANFNITFNYTSKDDPSDSRSETFKNVSLDPSSSRFVSDAINDVSQLVTVTEVPPPAPPAPPAPPTPPAATSGSGSSAASSGSGGTGESDSGNTGSSGSSSGSTSSSSSSAGTSSSTSTAVVPATPSPRLPAVSGTTAGTLTSSAFGPRDLNTLPDATHNSFMISLDGDTPSLVTLASSAAAGTDLGAKLGDVAGRIQTAVRKLKPGLTAYRKFTCTADTTNNQLVLTSGTSDANSSVAVTKANSNSIAQELHLLDGVSKSGGNPMLTGGKADPFTPDEAFDIYFGDQLKREGIYALDEIDLFNLLCLPGVTDPGILSEAISYCQSRRAFLIADAPVDTTQSPPVGLKPADMVKYITGPYLPKGPFGEYAAIYYPWVRVPDPLNNGKLRSFPPSGMIAGLYARTDSSRGVWKAPAGTEATLLGVQALDYLMTDMENGTLNPHGVNCLRIFPVYGAVCWGSRTVSGDDQIASDYKYVPVRRLALYIEESLYRGTKWVVFEPNDEPLWAQIRLNVGSFMQDLFLKGAFQGQTPSDAYLVKCDKETTTQDDINLGVVNILVAFAPLKPAEFVVLQIQQLAGQSQA
jgi:uncharacterized protein